MKKKLFISMLILVIVFVFCAGSALAASAGTCTVLKGDVSRTKTFTVDTGSRFLLSDYIKLEQSKGVMKYSAWIPANKSKLKEMYGEYIITVKNMSNGKSKDYEWDDKSIKLRFSKNTKYKVTIKPLRPENMQAEHIFMGSLNGWKSYPQWSVIKTKGIKSCR